MPSVCVTYLQESTLTLCDKLLNAVGKENEQSTQCGHLGVAVIVVRCAVKLSRLGLPWISQAFMVRKREHKCVSFFEKLKKKLSNNKK